MSLPSDLTDQQFDQQHIWHPYSSLTSPIPTLHVVSAEGTRLRLKDGRELIDAMASWWSAIHGYNHPVINAAAKQQIEQMSHVMFGGITHSPAIDLCRTLITITPDSLAKVFLSDSGSVAVDVAMKMALQYWQAKGQTQKTQFIALQGGYHGDTLGSMSVCDPDTGMHHLFSGILAQQHFVPRPQCRFNENCEPSHLTELIATIKKHHHQCAAVIVEPIVQGAGGMSFYSPQYLQQLRILCDEYDLLLICDEIATGFGRTGELFACHHANISPDIMCIGKAMTGGYLSLAATLTTTRVAEEICNGEAGAFMHGPTFMANPLACKIANTSIQLLLASDWKSNIQRIESTLKKHLLPLAKNEKIAEVRIIGAIGVIETHSNVDMLQVQQILPELGVWLRPFGKLIYTMPPYIATDKELNKIADAMMHIAQHCT